MRARVWFMTMSMVSVRNPNWLPVQTAIFASDKVMSLVLYTYGGRHPPTASVSISFGILSTPPAPFTSRPPVAASKANDVASLILFNSKTLMHSSGTSKFLHVTANTEYVLSHQT